MVTSNSGASVLEAYGKDVLATDSEAEQRRKVEEEVRRHSQRFEWHENGDLSVYHVVPGEQSNETASRQRLKRIYASDTYPPRNRLEYVLWQLDICVWTLKTSRGTEATVSWG